MDLTYKNLKSALKASHQAYFSIIIDFNDTKSWCFRVIDLFCFLKYSTIPISAMNEAIKEYNSLLTCLQKKKQIDILHSILNSVEKILIRCLLSNLPVLSDDFEETYKKCISLQKSKKYSFIVLTLYNLISNNDISTFDFLWNDSLKEIFQIIFGQLNNGYMEEFARKKMFGQEGIYLADNLFGLLEEIFFSSKNFKFFCKAEKVFEKLEGFVGLDRQDMRSANLKLTQFVYKRIENEEENEGRIGSGSQEVRKKRYSVKKIERRMIVNDNSLEQRHKTRFLTFGKCDLADVKIVNGRFPIDDLCFAILFNGKSFVMIDCSKYNYTAIRLKPLNPLVIPKDTLIDLALEGVLRIVDYKVFDNQILDRNDLGIEYEYVTGPLSNVPCGSRKKKIKSTSSTSEIVFGRSKDRDEYCDLRNRTSEKHISFMLNEDEKLCVKALVTKNGSYLLLKKYDEAINAKYSEVFPVFRDFIDFNETTEHIRDFYKEFLVICENHFEIEAERISDN